MKAVFLVCILIFSFSSAHAVQVAFFYSDGKNKFEGEFSHVAISYKGKWLHSMPKKTNGRLNLSEGVSIISNLSDVGLEYVIFENKDLVEPTEDFYNEHKHKSFNILADWNSLTETHCSILIGKFFQITPKPMRFKEKFWRGLDVKKMKGTLGLSPSEIYTDLIERLGFKFVSQSLFAKFRDNSKALKSCRSFL